MKILTIGDIVSQTGRKMVFEVLELLRPTVDLVVANCENAAHGKGLTGQVYNELARSGIDVMTLGNHTWGCPDIVNVLKYKDNIIRPANFEGDCPGSGYTIAKTAAGVKVGIINLIGRTYMQPASNPFFVADKYIEKLRSQTNVILIDFHAEATSEKVSLGYYLDGKVSAVFGTHTHIQTADDTVLPKGTGYITDLGMTGPVCCVLGMTKDIVIQRFLDGRPQKFEVAVGKGQFCGCIFEIDEKSGMTLSTERVFIRE